MVHVEATVEIGATPEAVTAVLLDADLAPQWTSDLERLEVVEGVPGEPGCLGRAHYRQGRRRSVLEDRLVEAVPNRRYRSHIVGDGMEIDVRTELIPIDRGTRLRLIWDGKASGRLGRIALRAMRARIRRRAIADLRSLQRVVESRSSTDLR